MKVSELIEALQKLDPEAVVLAYDDTWTANTGVVLDTDSQPYVWTQGEGYHREDNCVLIRG